ncbi:cell wall metabolism sensor histidine kinase WalK [Siccirubricoccus sp. G192]|uniref:sensor histidine kinase n=1 Tax=Siccirubricoccus sp. G192 TaxID=2849651 RepID=UPI001C2C0885|nr:ATP-binding protein [Siccirubricoccus sp. G192]MBV1796397.1 HAMP domain-containing histidine kinase [Siccirubricoccus sp. G192]
MERVTAAGVEFFVAGGEDLEQELREQRRLEVVWRLYRQVDRAAERVLALRSEGRQEQAVALFRDEIEERLDAELDRLLAEALAEVRSEVAEAEAMATWRRHQMAWTTGLVSLLALGATLLAGWQLRRSLMQPIAALAEAAAAIGAGDLGRRVAGEVRNGGELSALALRFDAMAMELGTQREALLRARHGLEEEVRRRTLELEEANLRLRQVDHTRARFLADLSHELRTPLTVLRGEAELALRGRAPPGMVERALEMVVRQATLMDRLVGDLLFLARSEAEITAFAPEPVALQDVVAEAVEEGAALTGRRPEDFLDGEWPEEPIPVDADPQRLKQAVLIAVENALKYGDAAAPVQVRVTVAEPGWAEVAIANTGPGLAPEELDRAFERFFRGRNARSCRADGSGLGLSIAKWIIERHGGGISLRSAPQGPTEVRLRLPIMADGLGNGEDTAGRG